MDIFNDKTEERVRLKRKVSIFAKNLIEARHAAGFDQGTAADALTGKGFPTLRNSVWNWEHDKSTPKLSTFVAYCHVLNVSPNQLLGFDLTRPFTKTFGGL